MILAVLILEYNFNLYVYIYIYIYIVYIGIYLSTIYIIYIVIIGTPTNVKRIIVIIWLIYWYENKILYKYYIMKIKYFINISLT